MCGEGKDGGEEPSARGGIKGRVNSLDTSTKSENSGLSQVQNQSKLIYCRIYQHFDHIRSMQLS